MRSRRLVLFVLVASIATLSQNTKLLSPATRPAKPQWTFNFPRTPLEIRADGIRSYSLENTSKRAIRPYRLGCVRESTNNSVIIVHRMNPEAQDIADGEGWGVTTFHCNLDRAACERKGAKLTVIEVDFKDRTLWRASAKVQEE